MSKKSDISGLLSVFAPYLADILSIEASGCGSYLEQCDGFSKLKQGLPAMDTTCASYLNTVALNIG